MLATKGAIAVKTSAPPATLVVISHCRRLWLSGAAGLTIGVMAMVVNEMSFTKTEACGESSQVA